MATSETTFYSDNTVNVTNARAVIGGKTYAMRNITSVSMVKKKINYVLVVILALVGLGGLFAVGQSPALLIVTLLCGAGIYFLVKPSYGMIIGSSSGESQALISGKRTYIEPIVKAMNDAIIHRG